jgi:folate-binding protein YgfZ
MSAYEAARSGCAFRRRHERGIISVTGRDRLSWLNGLLTNDLTPLTGGGACYAAWLTPQGRMITDVIVIERPETGSDAMAGQTLLDVPAPLTSALAIRLDSMIFAEDVRVADASRELTSVGIYGSCASSYLENTGGGLSPAGVERGQFASSVDRDGIVWTQAMAVGPAGAHAYLSPARAAGLEESLAHASATPLDDQTAAVLRVEAGVPEFLTDMNEETIPLEVDLDHAISHTKGCYVGQEIIVRIRDRAHGRVARRLVGLSIEHDVVPRAPQAITADGRHAGRLTSAVKSPAFDRPIALATLLRDFTETGTHVTLEDDVTAVVVALPFRPALD